MTDRKFQSKIQQRVEDGQQQQILPEMAGPSPSDAPDLLEQAYQYVKAQEESGFGDPLVGDNCENFDILQYINGGNDTPEGSPTAFCAGGTGIYQQQHQMLGSTAEFQAPLHKGTSASVNNCNFQQPILLDSVGLVMYNNASTNANNNQERMATGHYGNGFQSTRLLHDPRQQKQTRLPDSPPITDISGAPSSISPGSSGGGCDSVSPYSPDQFRYIHQQPTTQLINGGILLQHHQPNDDMLLINQMNLMGPNSRRSEGGMLIRSGTVDSSQLSPQSEFLSPYPPSQSTPGSQHSSQVSPPAIPHPSQNRQPFNYLLQNQPNHPALAGSFASTDNLYAASDVMHGNGGEMEIQQQFCTNGQQQGHKRRRMSSSAAPGSHESMPLNNNNILPNVKSEIGTNNHQHHQREDSGSSTVGLMHHQSQQQSFEDLDENMNMQKTIKFESYMRESWATLYDANQQPLPSMPVVVVADKGFNYSSSDNCFVNQKKNHFQITVNIAVNPNAAGSPISQTSPQQITMNGKINPTNSFTPRYIRVQGRQELLPIINQEFLLAFCGVKSEMQTYEVAIKQSQTDRKPIDHSPVRFPIDGCQNSIKQTVPRLHFSETTMNNHRKNGKPNPEQKYFLLVVKLLANTALGPVLIQAFHSDRVIVRASNPGQFEQPEPDQGWKCQNGALTFSGAICIGADKPIGDAQLTVHGNVATTGQITRPSDRRVKEDIVDLSTKDALDRLAQMRLVEFAYKPEIAEKWGLSEQDRHRVGVIAQELAEVLPEAVKDNGEFLTVDDTRVFYDTVAAAQELYRLTGNLESKIGQVEKISHKLAIYAKKRRQLGSMASGLSDFSTFFGPSTIPPLDNKSCVSYSRNSLTSTSTENDRPNDQKRNGDKEDRRGKSPRAHHRCRSYSSASAYCSRSAYCRGNEAALCSSKFAQGTIITLVFIMALCLVTMCTLYVMDWYNRTMQSKYFPGPSYVHLADPTNQPLSEANDLPPDPEKMIELLDPYWIPTNQNDVPPLSFNCPSNTLVSLVAGPFAPSCPQYCCSAENNYYEQLGEKFNAGVDSLVALASKFPHLFPQPSGIVEQNDRQIGALGNGAKIEILNLNATLDARYCLPENCSTGRNVCIPNSCNPRTGRFNLFMPISNHLPTIPFQIRFSFDDPTLLIEDCSNFTHFNVCHFQNELHKEDEKNGPRSYWIADNVFELTAGSFLRSSYKFRVGHSTGLCYLEEKKRGRIFDEYNLVFYRMCAAKGQMENANKVQQEKVIIGNATYY